MTGEGGTGLYTAAMFVSRALAHLPVLALAALLVTACGSQASSGTAADGSSSGPPSDGSSGAAPPGTPHCTSVWHGGATLPRGYQGCVQGTALVRPDALPCSSGQRIIRYADQYYAVPGGTIYATTKPLDHDRHYRAAAYKCRG